MGFWTKEEPKAKPTAQPAQSNVTPVPLTSVPLSPVSNDYKAHFTQRMKELNIPGPDYFEFVDALTRMIGLTDPQKYSLTYNSFAVMGVTKERLLDTAKTYLSAVDDERKNFEEQLKSSTEQGVDALAYKIGELQKINEELQAKISNNVTEMAKLNADMQANASKLASEKAAFDVAAIQYANEINQHISNITNYITT